MTGLWLAVFLGCSNVDDGAFRQGLQSLREGDASAAVAALSDVIEEGGPYHVRGQLENYLTRLRDTGRSELADRLKAKHIE
mgnify:CR=1 FL=1